MEVEHSQYPGLTIFILLVLSIPKTIDTIAVSDDVALNFTYYTPSGTLETGTTPWEIASSFIPVATVYWDGSAGLLGDERHGLVMDGATHD